ncbi:MAG TPA: hypothetical protein PK156_20935 [Polyangium sp.]|nr:hypothetical protein [Polyangium sp.]
MKKIIAFAALAVATFTGAAFAANYSISVNGGKGKANEKITSVVRVTAQGDYHINKEFPHKVSLSLPEGVAADDVKVKGVVENDHQLVFNIATTSSAAGKKDISADVRFAVCTETTCEPQTEKVSISVEAK